jgi:hypothetical protein
VPPERAPAVTRAARAPFEYAVLQVVPDLERDERLNVGLVLMCRPRRFLGARVGLDAGRLAAVAPGCDPAAIESHLEVVSRIAAGDPKGGPIARLTYPERFHWLVAPASTVVQPSAVHTGLTAQPRDELDRLFARLVSSPSGD